MGDDWLDLPVLARCGFAASVPEAPELVRERVHHVTRAPGGRGAAREVCELIMAGPKTRWSGPSPASSHENAALLPPPARLMAFLGVMTLWLQYAVLEGSGADAKPARHDPDSIVENFTVQRLDARASSGTHSLRQR